MPDDDNFAFKSKWSNHPENGIGTLPNGPLGTLRVDIQVTSDIPQEIAKLWLKYSNGEIGTFDLTKDLESIKNRQLQKTPKMEL